MKKKLIVCMTFIMIICMVGCRKKEEPDVLTLTPDNASLLTYDYLYQLAKEETEGSDIYAYKIEDFVSMCDYGNLIIEVDRDGINVSDEEVEATFTETIRKYDIREEIEEGKVSKEDTISITILAYIGDDKIDEYSMENYEYTVGGNLLADLDARLPGLKVGETYNMPTKFPEDYSREELAGKEVKFTITINSIIKYTPAEINNELIVRIATENGVPGAYGNVDEFKNYIKRDMYLKRLKEYDKNTVQKLWSLINEKSEVILVPEWELERAKKGARDILVSQYSNSGSEMTYEQYWAENGYDEAALEAYVEQATNTYIKEKLCIIYIAKKENVSVDKDTFESFVAKEASIEELKKSYGKKWNEYVLEKYYELLYDKVKERVYELYWRTASDN